MKPFHLFFILIAFSSLLTYCTGKPEQVKTVTIYGSNTCDHCIELKSKLDSAGIEYTFKDVEVNQQLIYEMLAAVRSINHKGQINYPVVKVDQQVFVAPQVKTVLDAME